MTTAASATTTTPGMPPRRLRPRNLRRTGGSFVWTLIAVCIVAAFLSPLLRSASFATKSNAQIQQPGSPLYPADPITFEYQGQQLDVYVVPIDGTTRNLALVKKGRQESQFIDPANVDAGLITWQGSWRALDAAWEFSPHLENFGGVWDLLDYPRLLFNTRDHLPADRGDPHPDLHPVRAAGLGGHLAAAAGADVLRQRVRCVPDARQFFLTLPRDLDEAASLDGASPLRVLRSVILPQSVPLIVAVAVFHLDYSWNDFFAPLIYLSTRPDLQPLAVGLASFNGLHSAQPALIQAGTLMTMVVPVVLFLLFQQAFTRGVVITGVEK